MLGHDNLLARFRAVAVPTPPQALIAVFISLLILALSQSQALLVRLGLASDILGLGGDQLKLRFDVILRSSFASQLALIAFWATIGLFAYLMCWSAYNFFVDARNKLTITTGYTNQATPTARHWSSLGQILLLKIAAALGLALLIASLKYGLSFWTAIASLAAAQPSAVTIAQALGAVIGLALQLYLFLALIQLTFTPWYRADTFTDA